MNPQEIFRKQKAHLASCGTPSVDERLHKLKQLRSVILKRKDEICASINEDFRKPPLETLVTEVYPVISELNFFLKHLKSWLTPERVGSPFAMRGSRSKVVLRPKGQVLIISPWNYPFNLCLTPLIDALAAGNVCVLKPSEYTPATNAVIKTILSEVFSKDQVAVIEGDKEIAQELLSLEFHHLFFTGSTQVGKLVMQAAAKHLSSVTLELGGKSPAVIGASADIKNSALKVAWGKFLNGGQTCVAPDFALVHESIASEFKAELIGAIQQLYPDKDPIDLASMIHQAHAQRLADMIEFDRSAVLFGGDINVDACRISPTLLHNVGDEHPCMQEEIFGPVLPVLEYSDESRRDAILAKHPRPLAMYIFSENKIEIEQILASHLCGGVAINDTVVHLANHELPFGGINSSGIGHYHGRHGLLEFSHHQAVFERTLDLGASALYPPYHDSKKKKLDWAMKKATRFL